MVGRSPLLGSGWSLSCDQPLASKIGADILQAGGNAADAAIAMAAGLSVLQPTSVGLGGDCFCLFYSAKDRKVYGLNASGRSPADLTLELVASQGYGKDRPIPSTSGLSVAVPGMPAGLVDTQQLFGSGKLALEDLLSPAILLAEVGFPVAPRSALYWRDTQDKLINSRHGRDLLLNGRSPNPGDIIRLPKMAATFKELASHGKDGFYSGRVAQAIAAEVQQSGGCLTYEDLRQHGLMETESVDPIGVEYRGLAKVWHLPPNCLGLVSLLALNILEGFDLEEMGHNSVEYLHTLLESLRVSFADGLDLICDPNNLQDVSLEAILSKKYATERRQLISPEKARPGYFDPGWQTVGSDTTYLSAVDAEGNACSFMATCCSGFGSGIVPEGCGFAITDRAGKSFSLQEGHKNVVGPCKRTLHTNMPSMVTDCRSGALLSSMGSMGYFLQPQTQVQVFLNMFEFGMNPQDALDSGRVALMPTNPQSVTSFNYGLDVGAEKSIVPSVITGLESKGFVITQEHYSKFGRGHVITSGDWCKNRTSISSAARREVNGPTSSKVLWTGCDSRSDGIAITW